MIEFESVLSGFWSHGSVVRFRIYMSRCFYHGIAIRALGHGISTIIGGLLMFLFVLINVRTCLLLALDGIFTTGFILDF